MNEDHFHDVKCSEITPKKMSNSISAFANTSGGEIYVGIREIDKNQNRRIWNGFQRPEDANAHLHVLDSLAPLANFYNVSFLQHPLLNTYVLQITIFKSTAIVNATNEKPYIRRGSSNVPVDTPEKLRRLELEKGIIEFENEPVSEAAINDLVSSKILQFFLSEVVPNTEGEAWISRQKLQKNGMPTLAGVMLFDDEPQIVLPKKSSIKIYRYKTSGESDRDMLDSQPISIEGCAYNQIYEAVEKTKQIIEGIEILDKGFEKIHYPEETLHEIITNAVIHRDYSYAKDIQIKIFDNRIEVESPGKLPGHVTIKNLLNEQSARNPKMVRIMNKFPNAPNKDVGEGLNTAFDAMNKLRLKEPEIIENEHSLLVIIRHEKLATPEKMVMDYLEENHEINNTKGRHLTGIKSENTMKQVFYRLRKQKLLELVPGRRGRATSWQAVKRPR